MKITKGNAGYLDARRKQLILKAVLEFGIVFALLGLGIWQTGTRLNLLTVVAVLGCLPASKALVEVITIFPYHSIAPETVDAILGKAEHLTRVFDLVVTSKDKIMPIDSVVILDNIVCGYTSSEKVDTVYAGKHIKQMMEQNQYTKLTVKIFADYKAFLARVEGMENMAEVNRPGTEKKEDAIRQILLNISL